MQVIIIYNFIIDKFFDEIRSTPFATAESLLCKFIRSFSLFIKINWGLFLSRQNWLFFLLQVVQIFSENTIIALYVYSSPLYWQTYRGGGNFCNRSLTLSLSLVRSRSPSLSYVVIFSQTGTRKNEENKTETRCTQKLFSSNKMSD